MSQHNPRSHGRSRRVAVYGALLATASLVAAPLLRGEAAASDGIAPRAAASEFARQMEADMRTMMAAMHAAPHSGNPDADFLAMMIPHHQGAIDMARLALIHGGDPLTRRLAEEIIASQTAEIAAMRARLDALRSGPDEANDYRPSEGTEGVEKARGGLRLRARIAIRPVHPAITERRAALRRAGLMALQKMGGPAS